MNNIVYLALDSEAVCRETEVSIHSLLHVLQSRTEPYRIIVYTNMTSCVTELRSTPGIELIIIRLDGERLISWRGPDNYVYRAKILALSDFMETYGEAAIFVDSDTFFKSDPSPLFLRLNSGVFLMNYEENRLDEMVRSKDGKTGGVHRFFHDIYRRRRLDAPCGSYKIAEDMTLWNSGIIGLPFSEKNLLREALSLSDRVYAQYRLRTAEQFALAYILQSNGTVERGDAIVFHYWFLKEARYLLERFLGLPVEISAKHIGTPLAEEIQNLPLPEYEQLPEYTAELSQKRWGTRFSSILSVISPESKTGKLLRGKPGIST